MRKRDKEEISNPNIYEDGYKGFNNYMECYNFKKYEIGKIFKEVKALLCTYGIHYCKKIRDVFFYYPPGEPNRYAKIKGRILKRRNKRDISNERKNVTTSLFVEKELSIHDIVYDLFFKELDIIKEIDREKVSDENKSYSGITVGNFGDVKHYRTIVANNNGSGTYINKGINNVGICKYGGSVSALDHTMLSMAITQGLTSISATTNGRSDMVICKGDKSRAYIGDGSSNSIAITSGDASCVDSTTDDRNTILCGLGFKNIGKGKKGNWLILAERDCDLNVTNIRAKRIDGEELKENTYYILCNNEFVEYPYEYEI